jgi:dTDP-glucose 4,6-dehydratase
MIAPILQPSPLAADLDHILIHTQDLWEELRGGAVFITGGTGFFGRWLLESFAEANRRLSLGAQAVVLTRHPDHFRRAAEGLLQDESIQLVEGNVKTLDADYVQAQLGPAAPDHFSHVIHAASETSEAANLDHPEAVIETAFEGTRRALDLAVKTGAKHFLLVSSGAVYGEQPANLSHLPETFDGAPNLKSSRSAYGEAKRVAELICNARARQHGLNCKIARCFAFAGPYLALDAHYAMGNFIRDALDGKTIQIKGDGTPFRSYLYAADLAVWLWTMLLNPAASGPFNVGSDEACSIRQLAETVARCAAGHPPVTLAQPPDPGRLARRYVPDVSRARRELGLEVWTALDPAVRRTLEFHQNKRRTGL